MKKWQIFAYSATITLCFVFTIGIYKLDKWKIPKIKQHVGVKGLDVPVRREDLDLTAIKHLRPTEGEAPGERAPEYFRQQRKSRIEEEFCRNITKPTNSQTVPPVYPYDGIGTSVNLSAEEYDTSHFRTFCFRNMSAIVQVYSAAQNYDRRKAIRATIGKQCVAVGCRVVFILAVSQDETVNHNVKKEYVENKDIFIKDKIDTYNDLNNKAVAMLDWLIEYCVQPRFVLQLIDDAFINVNHYISDMGAIKHTDRYFYGRVFQRQKPHRNIKSIYYVSKEIYPYNDYPDFVVGIAAAFPNSLTKELRCAVHRAKYVWMADVWLMGHIKEYLELSLVQTKHMTPDKERLNLNDIDKCLYVHHTAPEDFYRFQTALESKTNHI